MTTKTKAQKAEAEAQLREALNAAAPECSADTGKRCQGMTYALHHQGERGGGMEVGFYLNMKTGDEVGARFIYRSTKGNKILALRLCPWCGADVSGSPRRRCPVADLELQAAETIDRLRSALASKTEEAERLRRALRELLRNQPTEGRANRSAYAEHGEMCAAMWAMDGPCDCGMAEWHAAARVAEQLLRSSPESAPAPDAEARLDAFVKRYGATGVRLMCVPDARDRWALHWRRTYRDATSDERSVWGATLSAVVSEAESWEAENDAREPEHAAPAPESTPCFCSRSRFNPALAHHAADHCGALAYVSGDRTMPACSVCWTPVSPCAPAPESAETANSSSKEG